MKQPTSPFGEFVRKHRKALGFNQTALAHQLGVSQATIANWETGANVPQHHRLRTLADALSPATLFEAWIG